MRAALALLAVLLVSASGAVDGATLTRVSSDPFGAGVPGAHATEVEPSAVAVGSTIVSVFQVGRNFGGGAATIGFSTSHDVGRSWKAGLLPGLTVWTPSTGPSAWASDPVVAYDALRGRYVVITGLSGVGIGVSSSPDGLTWSMPITATRGFVDKPWLICDSWVSSAYRGRCYLAYTRFDPPGVNLRIEVQTSPEGGGTWGPPVVIPLDNSVLRFEDTVSAQPVVRPNGEVVVLFFEGRKVRAVRSTDGGTSFGAREAVADLSWRTYSFAPERLRAPNIPSIAVDAAGMLYAVWSDCRFRSGCAANEVVLARSPLPGVWTQPERVPLGATEHVLPAVAVQPSTRGAGAHLALAYYTLTSPDCTECFLQAGFATSLNGGRSWQASPVGSPMQLDWLAPTSIGRMVGDYVASVFVPGRAVGIFSLAGPPQAGKLDQATFAFSSPLPEPPRNTRPPALLGQPRVGKMLRCNRGSWTGAAPMRFEYAWLRNTRPIGGQAQPRYKLIRRDAGARISCRVRASNEAGAAAATAKALRIKSTTSRQRP